MTEGSPNAEHARSFEALSPHEKVKAILAGTKQPVSRTLAYDLAGIDLNQLDETESEALQTVFTDSEVEKSEHKIHGEQFIIPEDNKQAVFTNIGIDEKSVTGQITNSMLKAFYGTDLPSESEE